MLNSSSEGSNPSTPSNDTKVKGRGSQVYVPRHRRESETKSQADDKEVNRRDKTPIKNGQLKKSENTPIKESDSSAPSSPSLSTPPKQNTNTKSTSTNKSGSKDTKNTDSGKKTTKPKAKTVIVPLSLLDISDESPQKEEDTKSNTIAGPQQTTLSYLNEKETENTQIPLSISSTPTTTPSKSSTSAPSTPSITSSSSSPSSTTPPKKIPTHAISLVSLDDPTPPNETTTITRKELIQDEKETNNNNGKEGDTSGSEEEWEKNWEATLETLKVDNSNNSNSSSSINSSNSNSKSKTDTPNAVRGRGRKKFDDDGAEIGSSHPDMEGDGEGEGANNNSNNNSSNNNKQSNKETSLGSSEGALSSVDRADAQKQLSHILEIHSFPLTTTTEHLNDYLKDYSSLYRLKWVNDTSALAIFKLPKIATDALSKIGNGKYKMRMISEASEESLATASRSLARKITPQDPIRQQPQ